MSDVRIRSADASDIPTLARHRRNMFEEIMVRRGMPLLEAQLMPIEQDYAEILPAELNRTQVPFIIDGDAGERCVASAALWFAPWLSTPWYPTRTIAYLHSVWIDEPYRGRGYARALTVAVIDMARDLGYKRVVLHASEAGRPVYEKLGFVQGIEMYLNL